jgi:hypothetical protein
MRARADLRLALRKTGGSRTYRVKTVRPLGQPKRENATCAIAALALFAACSTSIAQSFREIPAISTPTCTAASFNSTSTVPVGVSADRKVVVGSSLCIPEGGGGSAQAEAFQWTASGGSVGLGFVSGFAASSAAAGTSGNGSTIVGSSRSAGQIQGFV